MCLVVFECHQLELNGRDWGMGQQKEAAYLYLVESTWADTRSTAPSIVLVLCASLISLLILSHKEKRPKLFVTHQAATHYIIPFNLTRIFIFAERPLCSECFAYVVRHRSIECMPKKECFQSSGIVDASEWPSKSMTNATQNDMKEISINFVLDFLSFRACARHIVLTNVSMQSPKAVNTSKKCSSRLYASIE